MSELSVPEYELIDRAKGGERPAFDELVKRYRKKALMLAFSVVGREEEAKDIAQEAFIRAFFGIKRFRGDSSFYSWLYRIVLNLCKDYFRKKKCIDLRPLPPPPKEAAAKEAVDNKELGRMIDEAVSRLPEKQRFAFMLKHFQGMHTAEIALTLGCARSTIKVQLFKAVRNLRRQLEPLLKDNNHSGPLVAYRINGKQNQTVNAGLQ